MTEQPFPDFFTTPQGRTLAYSLNLPPAPKAGSVVFCCGYASDMLGSKASFLSDFCQKSQLNFLRFDYSGHGQSHGKFTDGTIGQWYEDMMALILGLKLPHPLTIVGSSMGGWMAMLAARNRPEMVHNLILIAPAPDFPSLLTWPNLSAAARTEIENNGQWQATNPDGSHGLIFTKKMMTESQNHTLLDKAPFALRGKLRILHGTKDEAVPLEHGLRVLDKIQCEDAQLIALANGDHRLSDDKALGLLGSKILEVTH